MFATKTMRHEPAGRFLEPLLTANDLVRLLRVTRRTITRLCSIGELPPPLKIGGGNRWRADEIKGLISRQENEHLPHCRVGDEGVVIQ